MKRTIATGSTGSHSDFLSPRAPPNPKRGSQPIAFPTPASATATLPKKERMAMTGFLLRFRQRKLVQWALAYIAAAFALIQVLDVVAQRFGWPDQLEKLLILALVIGFVVMLVLAWYHGERGAQKVSGTEIVILALLLAIGGGLLWRLRASRRGRTPWRQVTRMRQVARMQRSEIRGWSCRQTRLPRSPPNPSPCCRSATKAAKRTSSTFPMVCRKT